ncbi:unnamed protein product, partial [Ixodes hexagonus]
MIPEALTVMDPSGFFCILYFSWLTVNAVGYMLIGPEVVLEAIFFEFPAMTPFRHEFAFICCVFFYVLGFATCTQEGTYLKSLLIHDLEILAAIVLLLETTVFVRVYGMFHGRLRFSFASRQCAPISGVHSYDVKLPMRVLLVLEVIQPMLPTYKDFEYNHWHRLIGVWIILFGVSFVPTYIYAMLTTYSWEEASGPLPTWVPDNRAIRHDYRRLLREFGLEMKPDSMSGAASLIASFGGYTSRGDTITIAETIDPREGATALERSVSFAPDVITSPRWANENFNELLEHQFGLSSTPKTSLYEHTSLEA